MKPFYAILLAIVIVLASFSPMMVDGGPIKLMAGLISYGEWAKILVVSYDLDGTPFPEETHNYLVQPSDPYFRYIQIGYEAGIFAWSDQFKSSDKLDVSFMLASLDRARGVNPSYKLLGVF
ncbi:MAG: hypothetical protein LBB50_04470 [Oscillospiraceae bacterium]|jgi:hypothetical protein|nr:hypothetical protein [Oscillospiraceae bacterium]